MKIEIEPFSIWKTLNLEQTNHLSKTFTAQKKHKIFSALSTPRTLDLKTKKTQHYWNQLQEVVKTQTNEESIQQQTHRKQASILAENHYRKRKQLQSQLKNNVLKQIFNKSLDKEESMVKLEVSQRENKEQNQQKLKGFIKRQQFKKRQATILKQMMEFIEFGSIRR